MMKLSLRFLLTALLAHGGVNAFAPLSGATATSVKSGASVDLSNFLSSGGGSNLLVLGTYAADFNAIEYAQRLRYYLPQLKDMGVDKVGFVLNCEVEAGEKLAELVDLDTDSVELLVDPLGKAGRQYGVCRGWKPDEDELFGVFTKKYSPYIKLFGMLWGLGAWATLPAVIGGYIGNPFTPQPWIEDAMAVGQRKQRWPDNALELDDETGEVLVNKFTELPVVGEWKRRPLELATLRLQNMLDVSIKNWSDLAPKDDALAEGVLTQLGGCIIVDSKTGETIYEWKDPGICAVANFEDVLEALKKQDGSDVEV